MHTYYSTVPPSSRPLDTTSPAPQVHYGAVTHSSNSSASSSVSRTCHMRSHLSVHFPLHDVACCTPLCLTTLHRHHDDVDSRHPKYTAPSSTYPTGGPSHSSFSHSHGNKSVHLSLTCHTASINSSFLHLTSGPVHHRLSASPCQPLMCALNCTLSCIAWLIGAG